MIASWISKDPKTKKNFFKRWYEMACTVWKEKNFADSEWTSCAEMHTMSCKEAICHRKWGFESF